MILYILTNNLEGVSTNKPVPRHTHGEARQLMGQFYDDMKKKLGLYENAIAASGIGKWNAFIETEGGTYRWFITAYCSAPEKDYSDYTHLFRAWLEGRTNDKAYRTALEALYGNADVRIVEKGGISYLEGELSLVKQVLMRPAMNFSAEQGWGLHQHLGV